MHQAIFTASFNFKKWGKGAAGLQAELKKLVSGNHSLY